MTKKIEPDKKRTETYQESMFLEWANRETLQNNVGSHGLVTVPEPQGFRSVTQEP